MQAGDRRSVGAAGTFWHAGGPMQHINDSASAIPHTRTMTEPPSTAATAASIPDLSNARAPGLLRRLATMLYDLMLLIGVVVAAAAVFYAAFATVTGRDDIAGAARLAFQVYLLAVIAGYYVYFWTGGRQTLGMRSWRTLLRRADGGNLTIADALRRLAFAIMTLVPLGAGLVWALFDRDGLTWYDRLSRTRPVVTAKPTRNGQ